MKKLLLCLVAVTWVFLGANGAFAKTKWDMHLNYPANNFHSKGAQEFADKVLAATNGELEIVLHPGCSLGFKGPELLRVLAEGQLAIAEVPAGMVEGDSPLMNILAQPFITTGYKDKYLLYELAKPALGKDLDKFNQFTLFTSVWPYAGIYTQKPITSAADLKGLKMRVYDGTGLSFGEVAGFASRKMPFSEVYPAMKAGLLNSMYTSSVSGVDAKAWEMFKYFTRINIVCPVNMFNVNKDAFKALPKDVQDKVLTISKEMEEIMWNRVAEMDEKSVNILKEQGLTVLQVDKPFRAELAEMGKVMREDWIKKVPGVAEEILDNFYKKTKQE
ncbi:MAG TPA: TRAP transporter substrate-binding protein [Syntrophales bacterium]|nr:TRAP transporter substrate-binding protein [Syntrophales bacterium]HPQ42724.1 TRAP transporter substrate-binding protein [Syntrophales bacterium]